MVIVLHLARSGLLEPGHDLGCEYLEVSIIPEGFSTSLKRIILLRIYHVDGKCRSGGWRFKASQGKKTKKLVRLHFNQ
jgi:hypothetical protein